MINALHLPQIPFNVVNCPRTTIFPSALPCSRNTITMSSWIEFLTLKSVLARHRCDIHQFLCISVGNFGMMCKLRHVSKEGILLTAYHSLSNIIFFIHRILSSAWSKVWKHFIDILRCQSSADKLALTSRCMNSGTITFLFHLFAPSPRY